MTVKNLHEEVAWRINDLIREGERSSSIGLGLYESGTREARLQELRRVKHWVDELKATILARIEEIRNEAKQAQELWRAMSDIGSPDVSLVENVTTKELQKILGEET